MHVALLPQCERRDAVQDVPVATQRLKGLVQGQGRERAAKVERRVGSELAHMLRKHVTLSLRVRVRKNATLPLLTQ